MTTKIPSKVIGIQFSILSADEIKKSSVAEVVSKDTYTNNKPVPGGLFDVRMGVIDAGLICPTDGLDHINTPGYFGHLELARPVFYIQYLGTVLKILKSVCFKCSKLLISKNKNKQLLELTPEMRWKAVYNLANKIKRCGEDVEDGCGCKQPKIRKEDLATIFADWKNDSKESITLLVTADVALKVLGRISNEDIFFMGFHPVWARPDSMICQVMAIPPPSVRPSIKHDLIQRCEDDLTHILVNIIKTNATLREKIQNNSSVADEWAKLLQYHFSSLVDNRFPGGASVAQRSGRPLKCIKDRLNGKGGRIRGNLMAKRVDFSARSVITADPNISLSELGIPLRIAKNITKPIIVNEKNRSFLLTLIKNGADVHPGAKFLETKMNGGDDYKTITLKYRTDRESIVLNDGDIVHRHILNGDAVLFNRQPTLHRMSMMSHRARVMPNGDTFRLNVAVTKPYNADFDGDEMNLHMPQDTMSDAELLYLAAVPYQIISPANNGPIIGIFQDSMLGSYQFTRENVSFNARDAMNLLAKFEKLKFKEFYDKMESKKFSISSMDILTQILPPISLKYKVQYKVKRPDEFDPTLIIENGKYLKGQIDKSVFGSKTRGIVHRICNDYGNMAATNFIDDLQNIITEYLKVSSFSVGISDLISADLKMRTTIQEIVSQRKSDVQNLINQLKLSVFENNTGKSNKEEFEHQVNNILNRVSKETQKVGLDSLDASNRFRSMVDAGSKGSELNISQMISCVGQQNVDGKRIPYGFDGRTLPHFTKYDDSPEARGFVLNSYVDGLTPHELFFHAMGGRIGLIDTAVKTSTTGYIQRRLIKGMEDLMVQYDMTVRSNKNKIIQFRYGDDNVDPIKMECQFVPFTKMTIQQTYDRYNLPASEKRDMMIFEEAVSKRIRSEFRETNEKHMYYTNFLQEMQEKIVANVFRNKNENIIYCPVAFQHIIDNIRGQFKLKDNSIVDITLLDAYNLIESFFERLTPFKPSDLFKALYFYFLSPKELIYVRRFHSAALTFLLETILLQYKKSLVAPGEMVGMLAAQSIGEPTTQMTLNTFHFSGISSKSNITRGVPRIEEILSLTCDPKNPSLTIFLKKEDEGSREKAQKIMYMLEHTKLESLVLSSEICFDPNDSTTVIEEDSLTMLQFHEFEKMIEEAMETTATSTISTAASKWIARFELNPEVMMEKNITMDDVHFVIKSTYSNQVSCVYSDYNADKLIFRIRLNQLTKPIKKKKMEEEVEDNDDDDDTGVATAKLQSHKDQTNDIFFLRNFQDQLMQNVVIKGVKGIKKVLLRKIQDNLVRQDAEYQNKDIWVLDTVGTNLLEVLSHDYIDQTRTISNDIMEVLRYFGIEAARQCIINELTEVIEFDDTYINDKHIKMLVDRITVSFRPISICRHGINTDNIGPIAKASFEETPEMFLRAAKHADLDTMHGVSANVMCGQEGQYGTNAFQVFMDLPKMLKAGGKGFVKAAASTTTTTAITSVTEEKEQQSNGLESLLSHKVVTKTTPLGYCDDKYDKGF